MAGDADRGRIPVSAVTIAAITAVALWSLKPIFISMIGDRGDYAEVYLVAGSISVLTSVVVSALLWRRVAAIARGGRRALIGVANGCLSGLFLGLWYYGFYRALYGADKADATIIAFTWPMIAVIAMRVFSPSTADRLKWHQWLLVIASFAGAVAVGLSSLGETTNASGSSGEIVWAFVAAIGSGLYLPFAINATNAFDDVVHSKPIATFFSISVGNVAALIAVASSLKVADHKLRFYAFDAEVIGICALIGIGTYLIAEVTWTWAFREYQSLTLSSLPYFSPAVSVVLLFLLFNEVIRPIAILGLVVILFSNLTLHARHRSTNALSLTLIATVFVALGAQVLPTKVDGPIAEMAAAVTGLFAILAGFILARAADRRTQEVDARAVLVRRVLAVDTSADREHADLLLRRVLELEFEEDAQRHEDRVLELYRLLSDHSADPAARDEAVDAFSTWNTMRMDRLSLGEWAALWTTGIGSILFVLLLRGDSILGNIGAVLFSAGALMAIFTIFDYDRNNIHGFSGRLGRLQQGFREIGKDYYVPLELLESGEIAPNRLRGRVRTSVSADNDDVREATIPVGTRTFNVLYMAIAGLVIVGVLVLPLTGVGRLGTDFVSGPRPLAASETVDDGGDDEKASVIIADPHWAAATVIAELIKETLAPSSRGGIHIERVDQTSLESRFGASGSSFTIHPDLWLQNQGAGLTGRVASGQIQLNQRPYDGMQGLYVLDSAGTAQRLTGWEDLRRPEIAELFDTDGDGLAEIWIGPENWPSTEILRRWLDEQPGLRVELETYKERMFQARLKREAHQPKDGRSPLLFYSYEPGAVHGEFHPRLLTGAPFGESCTAVVTRCHDDVAVHIAWTANLAKAQPAVAQILGRMALTRSEVNDFVKAVETDGRSARDVAVDWMNRHPERVAQWRGTVGK